jgi:hypothetical protein
MQFYYRKIIAIAPLPASEKTGGRIYALADDWLLWSKGVADYEQNNWQLEKALPVREYDPEAWTTLKYH